MVAGMLLAGCGPYARRGGYTPRPASIPFDVAEKAPSPEARAVISVLGVRRSLPQHPERRGLELAVLIENLGDEPVSFDPADVELLDADLESIEGPVGDAPAKEIGPGASRRYELAFLLPRGADLDGASFAGLNARLTLEIGERRLTRSLSLERRERVDGRSYYHPYGYPYHHGFHFGLRHRLH